MARLRTIKPGFFMNEELASVPPLGRLLFEGLWCIAAAVAACSVCGRGALTVAGPDDWVSVLQGDTTEPSVCPTCGRPL